MTDDLELLDANRFDPRDRSWKTTVWRILRRRVFARWAPPEATLLDLGAGYCVVKAYVSSGRITPLPSTWTDRVAGESRFRLWKWLPNYLRWCGYAFRGRRR
jgi:hypothetical protein